MRAQHTRRPNWLLSSFAYSVLRTLFGARGRNESGADSASFDRPTTRGPRFFLLSYFSESHFNKWQRKNKNNLFLSLRRCSLSEMGELVCFCFLFWEISGDKKKTNKIMPLKERKKKPGLILFQSSLIRQNVVFVFDCARAENQEEAMIFCFPSFGRSNASICHNPK